MVDPSFRVVLHINSSRSASTDCSTLNGFPNCTRGLRRQRRSPGGGWPEGRRYAEKHAGKPLAGMDSGAVTPPRGDWRVGATAGADTDEEGLPGAEKVVYTV